MKSHVARSTQKKAAKPQENAGGWRVRRPVATGGSLGWGAVSRGLMGRSGFEGAGRGLAVQRKALTIGEPNDPYEQEADRVAAEVVQRLNSPAPVETNEAGEEQVQRQVVPSLQRSQLRRKMFGTVRRDAGVVSGAASPAFESGLRAARMGGRPLDGGFRERVEPLMGQDFSGVRVHTDGRADALSRSIQAKAFTTGSDVFFKKGEYAPGSRGGQELLAHELTHVGQQGAATKERQGKNVRQVIRRGMETRNTNTTTSRTRSRRNPQNKRRGNQEKYLTDDQRRRYDNLATQERLKPYQLGGQKATTVVRYAQDVDYEKLDDADICEVPQYHEKAFATKDGTHSEVRAIDYVKHELGMRAADVRQEAYEAMGRMCGEEGREEFIGWHRELRTEMLSEGREEELQYMVDMLEVPAWAWHTEEPHCGICTQTIIKEGFPLGDPTYAKPTMGSGYRLPKTEDEVNEGKAGIAVHPEEYADFFARLETPAKYNKDRFGIKKKIKKRKENKVRGSALKAKKRRNRKKGSGRKGGS